MPGQEKLTLKADIKYKSNWQQGTLKAQRRNKWICALKSSMEKLKIYGPDGDPNGQTPPTKYTQVPYEEVLRQEEAAKRAQHPSNSSSMSELHIPKSDWTFADQNSAIVDDSQDVFGEREQVSHNSCAVCQTRTIGHSSCLTSYAAFHDEPAFYDGSPSGSTTPADSWHAHGRDDAGTLGLGDLTSIHGRD